MMEPGSEFREIDILLFLMKDHEHKENKRTIMSEGVKYQLEEIPDKIHKTDITYMM